VTSPQQHRREISPATWSCATCHRAPTSPASGSRPRPADEPAREWIEKTNYFTVEVYGAQARNCAQYLRKGSRVVVDAELDWREWTDQQDNTREAVTFKARQVLFEGSRPTSAVTAADAGEQNGADPEPAISTDREPAGVGSPSQAGSASADDLPF
jgi:single-strand DNA-binding protein